jgi:hypothetical protein
VGASRPAHATLTLRFDNNPATDMTAAFPPPGQVTQIAEVYGGFFILLNFSTSNSASSGPGHDPEVTLSSVGVTRIGAGIGTLTLSASDTGFHAPTNPPLEVISSSSATFASGLDPKTEGATFNTYASSGSTLFTTSGPGVAHPDQINLSPLSASGTTVRDGFIPTSSTFTLTSVATYTLGTGHSIVSFGSDSIVPTPEPATLASALAGVGLFGFGAWLRRRRRAAA